MTAREESWNRGKDRIAKVEATTDRIIGFAGRDGWR